VTDPRGQLVVKLSGQEIDQLLSTGSYRLTLEANRGWPDNQSISGRSSFILHKGDTYIGLSPQEM